MNYWKVSELEYHVCKDEVKRPIPSMQSIEKRILLAEQGDWLATLSLYYLAQNVKEPVNAAQKEIIEVLRYTLQNCVEGYK